MSELMVYLNGRLVPDSQATISVHDSGFTLGDCIYEATRTFNGAAFKLDQHLNRLQRSLVYARIELGMSGEALRQATLETMQANRPLLPDDYWIYWYVSRGIYTYRHYQKLSVSERPPTVVIFCKPLEYAFFARGYMHGVPAAIPPTRRIPHQCLDPKIKSTSRMNLVLAEMEAKLVDPEAWSILLDIDGNIAENKSSNVFLVKDGALYTPLTDSVLAGITRETVFELAGKLGIPAHAADLQPYHALTADEAFFTASSYCIMPIRSVNGVTLGDGKPGPITRRLLAAWGEMVGVDLLEQARKYL
jgi:branched-chain amino acid aminotransferase